MPAKLYRTDGDGPSLLLIHGFGGDRLGWMVNAPAFEATHTVWTVDLPAHGAAEPVETTVPDIAASLAEAASDIPGPVHLWGHSLGAAIAAELVAREPEKYGKCILIAPAGYGAGPPDPSFLRGFAGLQTEADALALLGRLVHRQRLIQPAMAQHTLAHLERPGRRAALAAIAEAALVFAPPPLPKDALVIWGDKDRIVPPNMALLAQLGPRGLLVPNAGHLPHVEAAAAVNRAVQGYLA